jgi:hypothetical protein
MWRVRQIKNKCSGHSWLGVCLCLRLACVCWCLSCVLVVQVGLTPPGLKLFRALRACGGGGGRGGAVSGANGGGDGGLDARLLTSLYATGRPYFQMAERRADYHSTPPPSSPFDSPWHPALSCSSIRRLGLVCACRCVFDVAFDFAAKAATYRCTCVFSLYTACLAKRPRALLAELPGAVVGACTRPRRISRATREALLPIDIPRFGFYRICLNLKIWNRLMGRFEYMPVDSRWGM